MKKDKRPAIKFQIGTKVFNTVIKEYLIVADVNWNGYTWMYSFFGTDNRCSSEYLILSQ